MMNQQAPGLIATIMDLYKGVIEVQQSGCAVLHSLSKNVGSDFQDASPFNLRQSLQPIAGGREVIEVHDVVLNAMEVHTTKTIEQFRKTGVPFCV